MQLFKNTLMKSFVTEFSRVLGCILQPCVLIKNDSTSENFVKFLKIKLSPQKSLQPTTFLWIDLSTAVSFSLLWEISCLKHVVIVFSFSKKGRMTRLTEKLGAWKTESVNGYLLKAFYTFGNILWLSLLVANLQPFLVKLLLTLFTQLYFQMMIVS